VTELSTAYLSGRRSLLQFADPGWSLHPCYNERFTVSYITGSHALKAGVVTLHGFSRWNTEINGDMIYQFLKRGTPSRRSQDDAAPNRAATLGSILGSMPRINGLSSA